jgi:hypothetical protein
MTSIQISDHEPQSPAVDHKCFGNCVRLLLILAAVIFFGVSESRAQDIPAKMAGVWAEGDCDTAERVRLLNSFGMIDFVPVGGATYMQMLFFQQVKPANGAGIIEATLVSPSTNESLDHAFEMLDGRLDGTFARCRQPPLWLTWTFGEMIAAFTALDTINSACGQRDSPDCLQSILDYADVTRDGLLTVAEVTRVFRALGVLIAYAAQPQALLPVENLTVATAVAGFAGPFFAKTVIEGMDYDGDGALSVTELLQDRGDAAGVSAALQALKPATGQTMLKAAFAALPLLKDLIGAIPF